MENSIHFFKNSTPRKILPPPPRIPWGGQKNSWGGHLPPPRHPNDVPGLRALMMPRDAVYVYKCLGLLISLITVVFLDLDVCKYVI